MTSAPAEVRIAGTRTIPDIGTVMSSQIGPAVKQVLLVLGAGHDSGRDVVSLWSRTAGSWRRIGSPIAGHNGVLGWTADHRPGDRRTPIGVFALTEAGGSKPNPGTRLLYEYNQRYFAKSVYLGNSPTKVFDYVAAIDFNRPINAPITSTVEPLGAGVGGGIWLHVDDGRATEGCVTVPLVAMIRILRWLQPREAPEIVMGDPAALRDSSVPTSTGT